MRTSTVVVHLSFHFTGYDCLLFAHRNSVVVILMAAEFGRPIVRSFPYATQKSSPTARSFYHRSFSHFRDCFRVTFRLSSHITSTRIFHALDFFGFRVLSIGNKRSQRPTAFNRSPSCSVWVPAGEITTNWTRKRA